MSEMYGHAFLKLNYFNSFFYLHILIDQSSFDSYFY